MGDTSNLISNYHTVKNESEQKKFIKVNNASKHQIYAFVEHEFAEQVTMKGTHPPSASFATKPTCCMTDIFTDQSVAEEQCHKNPECEGYYANYTGTMFFTTNKLQTECEEPCHGLYFSDFYDNQHTKPSGCKLEHIKGRIFEFSQQHHINRAEYDVFKQCINDKTCTGVYKPMQNDGFSYEMFGSSTFPEKCRKQFGVDYIHGGKYHWIPRDDAASSVATTDFSQKFQLENEIHMAKTKAKAKAKEMPAMRSASSKSRSQSPKHFNHSSWFQISRNS